MSAAEHYKAGQLQQAVDAQIQEVKNNPGDHSRRLFLFELLAFAGELDRAQKHIEAINYGEMERDSAVITYKRLLDAERLRRRLFAEGLQPKFLLEPAPEHLTLRLEAVNRLRDNNLAEAKELLERADQAAPPVKGTLNDKPFEVLRDADDLFGHIVEVFAHGDYFWVPMEQIDTLAMNPPRFPRDLIWFPARLAIREGPAGDVFLPALYPGSHTAKDDQVRFGRMTDWVGPDSGPVRGVGLRTYLIGEEPISILEWRNLEVHHEG